MAGEIPHTIGSGPWLIEECDMEEPSRLRTIWVRIVEVSTVAAFPLTCYTVESGVFRWTVAVFALAGFAGLVYPILKRQQPPADKIVSGPGRPPIQTGHIEHGDTLIVQDNRDYFGVIAEGESQDAFLYCEATRRLQDGDLNGGMGPDVAVAIGTAVNEWVARAYRTLANEYPGSTIGTEKKRCVMNKLHRVAYKWMPSGRIITFTPDNDLRQACFSIVECVERWVEQEFMQRK